MCGDVLRGDIYDRQTKCQNETTSEYLAEPACGGDTYIYGCDHLSVSIKDGKKWQSLANAQQLKSTAVSASRGTIYDSNGTVLSQSATVYTVYADPLMLKEKLDDNDKKIEELKGYIAKEDDASKKATYQQRLDATKSGDECLDELVEFLALNLEIDTNTVREKLTKTDTQYIVLKKRWKRPFPRLSRISSRSLALTA